MNKFTLSIDLGNEAMSTPDDVRNALLKVADLLLKFDRTPDTEWSQYDGLSHSIRDTNGNRVGEWLVEDVEEIMAHISTLMDLGCD